MANSHLATRKHFALIEEVLAYLRNRSNTSVKFFSKALYKAERDSDFNVSLDKWLSSLGRSESIPRYPDLTCTDTQKLMIDVNGHVGSVKQRRIKSLTNFER